MLEYAWPTVGYHLYHTHGHLSCSSNPEHTWAWSASFKTELQSNSSLHGSRIKLCCPYCSPVHTENLATSFRKKKTPNWINCSGQSLFLKSGSSMLAWSSKLSKGSNHANQSCFIMTWWNVRVDRFAWLFLPQSCFLTHLISPCACNFSKLYLLAQGCFIPVQSEK